MRSSNINEDTFVKGEDDVFVNIKAINIPFVRNGDIIITSANGSSRLVGKHAIIREITDNSAVHGGFMLLATAKNPQFLNASMGASWYIKFINLFVAGGNGAIGNLNKNDLDEQTILVPYETEQELIGCFFENLDHLITLHQSKSFWHILEAIVSCTLSWEQRKWIDVVDISKNMVDPRNGKYDNLPHISPGNIESFTGQLYDNVKCVKDENLISGKFKFSSGDIIYGKINPQLGKYLYATFSGLTSADAYVLNAKNEVNQKYLYTIIQTRNFFEYSVSVSMRSGMPKINRDELNVYSFFAPATDEQLKIGNCILKYDHLITLHQLEPFKLIFKAIAYRIIDYAKGKPPRYIKLEDILLVYKIPCMKIAYIRNINL